MLEQLIIPMEVVVEEEQNMHLIHITLHHRLDLVLLLLQVIQLEEILEHKVEMVLTLVL